MPSVFRSHQLSFELWVHSILHNQGLNLLLFHSTYLLHFLKEPVRYWAKIRSLLHKHKARLILWLGSESGLVSSQDMWSEVEKPICSHSIYEKLSLFSPQGTLCEDWMAVHCCWPFAVCQAARELKRRATTQIYEVNAAPAAIDAPVLKCPATELELWYLPLSLQCKCIIFRNKMH